MCSTALLEPLPIRLTDLLSELFGGIPGPDLQEVLERGQGHVEAEGEGVAQKEDEKLVVLKRDAVVHLKKTSFR